MSEKLENELYEFRFAVHNQFIGSGNHIAQEHDDRGVLDDLRLADAYIKVEAHILIRMTFGENQEFVASFQRLPEFGRPGTEGNGLYIRPRPFCGRTTTEQAVAHADSASEQSMVLVGNVQLVEYPEKVALPALVRFGISDLF